MSFRGITASAGEREREKLIDISGSANANVKCETKKTADQHGSGSGRGSGSVSGVVSSGPAPSSSAHRTATHRGVDVDVAAAAVVSVPTAKDRIEWSRSTILRFIDDYRQQRVLWDSNTKGYHIKQTKYEALKVLSQKYGTEIRSIRSKIKSLRSSFHREHGKVINGRRRGINYQPMWFAYEAIRFILDNGDGCVEEDKSDIIAITRPSSCGGDGGGGGGGGVEAGDSDVSAGALAANVGGDADGDAEDDVITSASVTKLRSDFPLALGLFPRLTGLTATPIPMPTPTPSQQQQRKLKTSRHLQNFKSRSSASKQEDDCYVGDGDAEGDEEDGGGGGGRGKLYARHKLLAELAATSSFVSPEVTVEAIKLASASNNNNNNNNNINNGNNNNNNIADLSEMYTSMMRNIFCLASASASATATAAAVDRALDGPLYASLPPPCHVPTSAEGQQHNDDDVDAAEGGGILRLLPLERSSPRLRSGRMHHALTDFDDNGKSPTGRDETTTMADCPSVVQQFLGRGNDNNHNSSGDGGGGGGGCHGGADGALTLSTNAAAIDGLYSPDYDSESQPYYQIRAEDVKTELIESESIDLVLNDRPYGAVTIDPHHHQQHHHQHHVPNVYALKMKQSATAVNKTTTSGSASASASVADTATGNRKRKTQTLQHVDVHDGPAKQARMQQQQHSSFSNANKNNNNNINNINNNNINHKRQDFPVAGYTTSAAPIPDGSGSGNGNVFGKFNGNMPGNQMDEFGVFGEYVAITIRKLKTFKSKIVVKHLINNLLFEAELGKYDQGMPSSKEPPQLYRT